MCKAIIVCIICIFLLLPITSCSGASGNLLAPPVSERPYDSQQYGPTTCLGLWQVAIDAYSGNISVTDLRTGDLMLNVLGFLEPPPMKWLTIDPGTLIVDQAKGKVKVDVILKHPFKYSIFMGFDVRGVVFGPKVTNADGMTPAMAPEFFTDVPYGYKDGLWGTPDKDAHFKGSLWGYKYFCDGLGKNDDLATFFSNADNVAKRGVFANGSVNKRHYELDWTDSVFGFLIFNYAVYANYNRPTGEKPIDINDFDITTANSAEAFCCRVTETKNTLWWSGGVYDGELSLEAEIWDWQNDISDVTIESLEPGILDPTPFDSQVPGNTPYSRIVKFDNIDNFNLMSAGDLDLWITVTDQKTFGEAWFMGLLPESNSKYKENVYNCFIHRTESYP